MDDDFSYESAVIEMLEILEGCTVEKIEEMRREGVHIMQEQGAINFVNTICDYVIARMKE